MTLLKVLKAPSVIGFAAALALAGLALLSCSDDEAGPEVEDLPRDTPARLIESFCTAFEDRLIDQYAQCLDDGYRFEFMPEDWDTAYVDEDAPYWSKAQDLASTTRMFESDDVIGLSCDFGLPLEQGACPDTLCLRSYLPDILVTVDRSGMGTTTYWVRESMLRVTMARDPQHPDLWVIRNLKEEPAPPLRGPEAAGGLAGSATAPSTFGEIKAMFRPSLK